MKNLTDNQIEFLTSFFRTTNHLGWYAIATALIKTGKCIVAGNSPMWVGGIGNFISCKPAEGAVDCLEYTFHLEKFIPSAYYKEIRLNYLEELSIEQRELEVLAEKVRQKSIEIFDLV